MSATRLCLLLATTAFLASCGGEQSSNDDARSSSGEVLEGTISDAMLPVDTVRSQPPLIRRTPAPDASGAADGETSEEADASEATPEADGAATAATPEPAEEPAVQTESEAGA